MDIKIKTITMDYTKRQDGEPEISALIDIFSDNGVYLGERQVNGQRGKIGVAFGADIKSATSAAHEKIKDKIGAELGIKKAEK